MKAGRLFWLLVGTGVVSCQAFLCPEAGALTAERAPEITGPRSFLITEGKTETTNDHLSGPGLESSSDTRSETPRGTTVDSPDSSRDSDRDGVLDGLDMCPKTAPELLVNEDGCPYDSDGDHILAGIDQCPDTPIGAVVDAKGCPVDGDGDGVPDGLDRCPQTIPQDSVDASGCSLIQKEDIVIPGIMFGFGRTKIDPASYPALNEVARLLVNNPGITVEIGGHTDNEGRAQVNRMISLQRAEAVKEYLISRGVLSSQMITKGYGEVHPVASNRHAEGRAKNRRIEFRVLSR